MVLSVEDEYLDSFRTVLIKSLGCCLDCGVASMVRDWRSMVQSKVLFDYTKLDSETTKRLRPAVSDFLFDKALEEGLTQDDLDDPQ